MREFTQYRTFACLHSIEHLLCLIHLLFIHYEEPDLRRH